MTKNLGTSDRVLRALAAAGSVAALFLAPLSLEIRAPLFGGMAAYLLFTSLAGSCLGYRLMGRSTCTVRTS